MFEETRIENTSLYFHLYKALSGFHFKYASCIFTNNNICIQPGSVQALTSCQMTSKAWVGGRRMQSLGRRRYLQSNQTARIPVSNLNRKKIAKFKFRSIRITRCKNTPPARQLTTTYLMVKDAKHIMNELADFITLTFLLFI